MIENILSNILDNKMADALEWLQDRGYTDNPGLARFLHKLADSVDVPADIHDADWEEVNVRP